MAREKPATRHTHYQGGGPVMFVDLSTVQIMVDNRQYNIKDCGFPCKQPHDWNVTYGPDGQFQGYTLWCPSGTKNQGEKTVKIRLYIWACAFVACAMLVMLFNIALANASVSCTTAANFGECFAGQNPYVQNNVWNANSAFVAQSLWAYTPETWYIQSTIGAGNKAVDSYPSTVSNQNDKAITSYGNILSTWDVSLPASPGSTDDYEAAYDIWLGGNYASPTSQEIMIWVDNYHQTPGGMDNLIGTIADHNITYNVYSANGGKLVSIVANSVNPTGKTGIQHLVEWIVNNHPFDGDNTVNSIQFGFEICSTSGANEKFRLNSYSLQVSQ